MRLWVSPGNRLGSHIFAKDSDEGSRILRMYQPKIGLRRAVVILIGQNDHNENSTSCRRAIRRFGLIRPVKGTACPLPKSIKFHRTTAHKPCLKQQSYSHGELTARFYQWPRPSIQFRT
jgi:hypothetical protein